MEKEIIENIKNLPVIPDVIYKIRSVCSDTRSSVADVVKIVEKDPLLTANLLRAANSPLYGFSREVGSISQAIALFGMSTVKGFAIVTAVKSRIKINLTPYGINEAIFLKTADYQNAFMVRWISKVDRTLLDLLSQASFLLEIGSVILSDILISKKQNALFLDKLKNRENRLITEIEKEVLGINSYQATSLLFEHWNFDESLVKIMQYVESPKTAPENLKQYVYPLAILHTLISLYEVCSADEMKSASQLVEEGGLNLNLFKQSVLEFRESIENK